MGVGLLGFEVLAVGFDVILSQESAQVTGPNHWSSDVVAKARAVGSIMPMGSGERCNVPGARAMSTRPDPHATGRSRVSPELST